MNEPNDLVAALATVDQLRIENARLRLTDEEREAVPRYAWTGIGFRALG